MARKERDTKSKMVLDNLLAGGFNPSKLKSNLKMAVTRLAISSNKKSALLKQQIRDIASMLADHPPREEKARIRAEAIIRDDNTIEAYEILQLHCELICERMHLIGHCKHCPPDLLSCVSTLMWASCVVDIPELQTIRTQFRCKYGKEFELRALQNVQGVVNHRVARKLSVRPPPAHEVQMYLEKIAEEQEVDWKPKIPMKGNGIVEPMGAPSGFSVPTRGGSGLFPSNNYHNVEEATGSQIMEGGGGYGGGEKRISGDKYDDDDDGGNYVGVGGGPSAPPLSPMTANTSLLPEAPKGKVWAQTNMTNTATTVTTMASTTTAAASSLGPTLPSPYIPVLPVPSCTSTHVHSSKNDATTIKEVGDYLHTIHGRNYGGDGDDDNNDHGDIAIVRGTKDQKTREEDAKSPNGVRGGQLKSSHSGLIAEATKMSNEYEVLIAKFEALNKKK